MNKIDICKILAEQAGEVEVERVVKILGNALSILSKQRAEAIKVLCDAAEFWQKRCERAEKQRDELAKSLEMLEKLFMDKDFIEEDESEDFLHHVWALAHGVLYSFKNELAREVES